MQSVREWPRPALHLGLQRLPAPVGLSARDTPTVPAGVTEGSPISNIHTRTEGHCGSIRKFAPSTGIVALNGAIRASRRYSYLPAVRPR